MALFSFEKLEVWQKARQLVLDTYLLLQSFPSYEQFGLCSQMRRSVISIPSNLAEGCGRSSEKERIHFFEIAMGSLLELFAQLQLSADIGYVTDEQFEAMREKTEEIARMISGLKHALEKRLHSA